MKLKMLMLALTALFFTVSEASAVQTKITVRVKTKDAKFLGTSMGGAKVTITDVKTGKLLAEGVTEGSTGNSKLIMMKPIARGSAISDRSSARYTATIDIAEPSQVEITASGPLSEPQAINKVSVTQWVVPGKHIIEGDAMMLELPGLMVKIKGPDGAVLKSGQEVQIGSIVRMM